MTDTILEKINEPADIKKLSMDELMLLAAQIRETLVETVSKNGGHLASNLGVVELTIALHRVFDCPTDKIVFDVGHQAYVHKLLTARREAFSTIRTEDGLSGFPKRTESAFKHLHFSGAWHIARVKAAGERRARGRGDRRRGAYGRHGV